MKSYQFLVAAALAVVGGAVATATASSISQTFSASQGNHSAEATFTFSDAGSGKTSLNIKLTNTMSSNTGPNWLTGLYFDLAGSPELTYQSATGDLVKFSGTTPNPYSDQLPGQYWAYNGAIQNGQLPFGSQQYGLSAVGAGVFNNDMMLEPGGPHPQPNGVDGGIVGDFSGVTVPNGHQNQGNAFLLGSIEFNFLIEGMNYADGLAGSVAFHFGSGFDEVTFGSNGSGSDEIILIPLPAPVLMGVVGLIGLVGVRRGLARSASTTS